MRARRIVGRAVHDAVVVSFLGFGAFNCVFPETPLATHTDILVIRRVPSAVSTSSA